MWKRTLFLGWQSWSYVCRDRMFRGKFFWLAWTIPWMTDCRAKFLGLWGRPTTLSVIVSKYLKLIKLLVSAGKIQCIYWIFFVRKLIKGSHSITFNLLWQHQKSSPIKMIPRENHLILEQNYLRVINTIQICENKIYTRTFKYQLKTQ